MTEKMNNCFLLHTHKDLTDDLDLVSIAKEFIQATDEHINYFGNFKRLFTIFFVKFDNFIVIIRRIIEIILSKLLEWSVSQ